VILRLSTYASFTLSCISGRRLFRMIDDRLIEREGGEAVIECLNRRATKVVVFVTEKGNEVLGLHALEGLGLEVDPSNW